MKNKHLIIHICVIIILNFTNMVAQKITWKEHTKYWYYRARLLDEFVITGLAGNYCEASGLSIPAQGVGYYQGSSTTLKMGWGDNVLYDLGMYIGVLATELRLLYQYGQPYAATQQELYYAMMAYERLDRNAEYLYLEDSSLCPNGHLDGFAFNLDLTAFASGEPVCVIL